MTLPGIAARNLLRSRLRFALTLLSVATAALAFVVLRTIVSAAQAQNRTATARLFTRNATTMMLPVPKRDAEDVRNVAHVQATSFARWFGGREPNHLKDFFAVYAVDGETYFDVYTELQVPPQQMDAWRSDPQGAIVGRPTATKMGWKVGDRVQLVSDLYPQESSWQFTVDGIYDSTSSSVERTSFFFHWQYLNLKMAPTQQDQIDWIVTRVDDLARAGSVATSVDTLFADTASPTLTEDERTFNALLLGGYAAILDAVGIVSLVILILMVMVLGNTIAMGVRERTSEYGALKALGFTNAHIQLMIASEAVLTALAGAALGLAVSYPLMTQVIGRFIEENMGNLFPEVRIAPGLAIGVLVSAVLAGVAAAALPAVRVSRLSVVDALRRTA
jgi:putative ABC transport system permease protein